MSFKTWLNKRYHGKFKIDHVSSIISSFNAIIQNKYTLGNGSKLLKKHY
jgi:hypothetical protein